MMESMYRSSMSASMARRRRQRIALMPFSAIASGGRCAMPKDIKDYLHLYLGCNCQQMGQEDETKVYKLTGISYDDTQRQWWAYFENEENMYAAIEDVFL